VLLNIIIITGILTRVMPMFPTFSLDELTPEPVPRKPAKIVLIPWMPIPRFTALGGGFVKSTTV